MNIFQLITPINRFNSVNHPRVKQNQDYYSQHSVNTSASYKNFEYRDLENELNFMKRRKLSTNIYGMKYNDNYIRPKITVGSTAMKVTKQDRTPLSKRVPVVMQNPSVPFGDPSTRYDELLTASQSMLASVEPINYFGCRIVGNYLYNFDLGMIFQIIPKDILLKYMDPTQIKESFVYIDSHNAMIMSDKAAFKNIWMDTKKYKPIHPNYTEIIDLNNLPIYQQEQENNNIIVKNAIDLTNNLLERSEQYINKSPVESNSLNSAVLEQQPVEAPVESNSLNSAVFEQHAESPVDEQQLFEQAIEQINSSLPPMRYVELPDDLSVDIDSDENTFTLYMINRNFCDQVIEKHIESEKKKPEPFKYECKNKDEVYNELISSVNQFLTSNKKKLQPIKDEADLQLTLEEILDVYKNKRINNNTIKNNPALKKLLRFIACAKFYSKINE